MIRPIVCIPDPILRRRSDDVKDFEDPNLQTLIDDMLETMRDAGGMGLAAIQIGLPLRLAVVELQEEEPLVLANPVLSEFSQETESSTEGCLSIPGVSVEVTRSVKAQLSYVDGKTKEPHSMKVEGLLARCLQHELDHLDGRLLLDYLSYLKRSRILKRLEKRTRGK